MSKSLNSSTSAKAVSYTHLPKVKLYKDTDVEIKDVDMVVDIGNSRTTALLIEDNTNSVSYTHLDVYKRQLVGVGRDHLLHGGQVDLEGGCLLYTSFPLWFWLTRL